MSVWFMAQPVIAATLAVGNGQPYATIGDAVDDAVAGDVIEVEPGDYSDMVTIDIDLTIRGVAGSSMTTWRNGGFGDVMSIANNAVVVAEGLSLRGGLTGRAADVELGSLTGIDLDVRDNRLNDRSGAAFRVRPGSTLVLQDCWLEGNTTNDLFSGGHIFAEDATVTLVRTRVEGGYAAQGGAIAAVDTRLTLEDCELVDNSSPSGGALDLEGSTLTATGTLLSGNRSDSFLGDGSGGAARIRDGSIATLSACRFEGNSTDGQGGAIQAAGAASITISASFFNDNDADSDGGALFTDGSTAVAVDGSRFETGHAGSIGGALVLEVSNAEITGNTFCDNTANFGAAVYERGTDSRYANNVFQGNTADDTGGGIRIRGGNGVVIVNNTFVDNGASDGGAVAAVDASVDFVNNVVAHHHTGGGVSAENTSGGITYSMFGDNQPANVSPNLLPQLGPDVLLNIDPLFVAYDDDGQCDDDLHPDVGSPLIDAGDPSILDAGGSRSDIGAYGGPDLTLGIDADSDGYDAGVDCDDADDTVNPGAEEDCSSVDRDCTGDPFDAESANTWHDDDDGDGFGDPLTAQSGCTQPANTVADGSDCDDADATVNPAAAELCDDVDHDCDGDTYDVDTGEVYFPDNDGDGYGAGAPYTSCVPIDGYVTVDGDCDDADPAIHPGVDDTPGDGIDANCDGQDGAADTLSLEQGEAIKAGGGCGCDQRGAMGAVVGLLPLLVGFRRRR